MARMNDITLKIIEEAPRDLKIIAACLALPVVKKEMEAARMSQGRSSNEYSNLKHRHSELTRTICSIPESDG